MKYLSGTSGGGGSRGTTGSKPIGIGSRPRTTDTPKNLGEISLERGKAILSSKNQQGWPSTASLGGPDPTGYLQSLTGYLDDLYNSEKVGWEELKANAHEDDPYPGNNPVKPEPEDDDPGLGDPWIGPGSMW